MIANDLGAVGELVRESGGGFAYRTEDELLDAVRRLRDEAGLRNELGHRGQAAWIERWSEEPHVTTYLRLIDETIERRRIEAA